MPEFRESPVFIFNRPVVKPQCWKEVTGEVSVASRVNHISARLSSEGPNDHRNFRETLTENTVSHDMNTDWNNYISFKFKIVHYKIYPL